MHDPRIRGTLTLKGKRRNGKKSISNNEKRNPSTRTCINRIFWSVACGMLI